MMLSSSPVTAINNSRNTCALTSLVPYFFIGSCHLKQTPIESSGHRMREEVIHEQAAEKARKVGIYVVMDRCILQEHRARFG